MDPRRLLSAAALCLLVGGCALLRPDAGASPVATPLASSPEPAALVSPVSALEEEVAPSPIALPAVSETSSTTRGPRPYLAKIGRAHV